MRISGLFACMAGFCLAADAALIIPGEPLGMSRVMSIAGGLVLFAVGSILCLSGPKPRHH